MIRRFTRQKKLSRWNQKTMINYSLEKFKHALWLTDCKKKPYPLCSKRPGHLHLNRSLSYPTLLKVQQQWSHCDWLIRSFFGPLGVMVRIDGKNCSRIINLHINQRSFARARGRLGKKSLICRVGANRPLKWVSATVHHSGQRWYFVVGQKKTRYQAGHKQWRSCCCTWTENGRSRKLAPFGPSSEGSGFLFTSSAQTKSSWGYLY